MGEPRRSANIEKMTVKRKSNPKTGAKAGRANSKRGAPRSSARAPAKGANVKAANVKPANVNAPQQRRSEATQARILEAVERLLREERYAEATVQDIAALAECSIGAYYGRFKDKNAALYMFYDARCAELEEKTRAVLEQGAAKDASLKAILDRLVETMVDQQATSVHILRASAMLAPDAGAEVFWARARAMNEQFFTWIEELLRKRRDEHSHPNPRIAALYTVAIIGGLSRDAMIVGARLAGGRGDLASFKRELKRAVRGYLGVGG